MPKTAMTPEEAARNEIARQTFNHMQNKLSLRFPENSEMQTLTNIFLTCSVLISLAFANLAVASGTWEDARRWLNKIETNAKLQFKHFRGIKQMPKNNIKRDEYIKRKNDV